MLILASAKTISASSTIEKIETKQQQKMDRLERNMSAQQTKIQDNKKIEATLYTELKEIDKKLLKQQDKIQSSQKKLMRQEGFLQEKEFELTLIRKDKQKAEVHIKNRLHSFYQMGDIGVINTLFSASTLPDLLNTKEYFHYLFQYDRIAIKRYKDKLALLAGAQQNIMAGKDHLLNAIVAIKDQEKALITLRQERSKLLKKVRTEEQLYKQALNEMQKSASSLTKRFNQYKTTLLLSANKRKTKSSRTISKPLPNDFTGNRGKIHPPVSAGIVTNYFGKSKGIFGVEIQSNGIDIQIKNHTKVKAIFSGRIVYAGELTGYGNVVIIDHGQQYFSLVSRMNSVLTKKGIKVKQGQIIGAIDQEHSGLLNSGLHLEIRQGSQPVDPLKWIDKTKMTLKLTQNM